MLTQMQAMSSGREKMIAMRKPRASRRACIARRCPTPWTEEHRKAAQQMSELLRADIEVKGGLRSWLEWARTQDGCPIRTRPHRPARRRPNAA